MAELHNRVGLVALGLIAAILVSNIPFSTSSQINQQVEECTKDSPCMDAQRADPLYTVPFSAEQQQSKCSRSQDDVAHQHECSTRCSRLKSSCNGFFVGDAWPKSSFQPSDSTCRICQTLAGDKKSVFATAFNTHYRIPEYTASAITRDPDVAEQERPSSSLWDRVQLGLCGKKVHDAIYDHCDEVETDGWGVTRMSDIWKASGTRCRLSNPSFDDLQQSYCGDCQALDDDYSGCGTTYNRGHINPNAINDKDADVQDGTFSMINVAPQDDDFNQCVWQPYECAVGRKADEVYKNAEKVGSDSKTLYVITGTKLGQHTTWMKGRVAIPGYYWKALCYPGDESKGLRPFGVGFYGPNIDCSTMTSLPLDKFEAWLYDGADEHLFPGSVCAGPVDNWEGLDAHVAEIAHDCRNEHIQETCESSWRDKRCGIALAVKPTPSAIQTETKCSRRQDDMAPIHKCSARCSRLTSSCDSFFVGDAWPKSSFQPSDSTCRICQTLAGDKKSVFATAFNTHYRIPEYTASAITRDPDIPEQERPSSSLWDRVQLGLCGKKVHDAIYDSCDEVETDGWGVTRMSDIWKASGTRCRLSNPSFDDLQQSYCGDCQALDDDYSGCGTTYNRGHINPNAINNKDADVQDGTFSMINVAPQDDDFNQCVWQPYECAVGRKADEVYKNAEKAGSNSKTLYVITGTKLGQHTTWMKGRVAIPGYYWKALCYPGDESKGLRPFGVGFYGPNIDCSTMTSLPLDKFEAWLYDGADEHLFPGSVCAGPVDNWEGLDAHVAEIAHDCRNEHIQETCESSWRDKRCGTSG
ncbi:Hypp4796 [Branchiostoma lanceolatum]|uniref:Hypp4796 protein n=1 Tax=Branchiostoma lanceolatum TaxID=7740 RepID=A0A8K0AGG8_BRALA|nr:Hypp4796 [Branchiostoma lanceolatum]